jgi:lysophospholipase
VDWAEVLLPSTIAKFQAHKQLDANVAALRIFPGITANAMRAFLGPPIKGVGIETFGAGNMPSTRPDVLQVLKEACERGVVLVNCTQCKKGIVSDLYATAKPLVEAGVVFGRDMTPEARDDVVDVDMASAH